MHIDPGAKSRNAEIEALRRGGTLKTLSRKHLAPATNAVLTGGLLVLLAQRIDASRLLDLLVEPATLRAIFFATAALMLQSGIGAMRQIELVGLFDQRLTLGQSLAIWVRSLFISQVFMNSIAGEISRGIQFAREGMPVRIAVRAVLLDRVIGLVLLLGLVAAVTPILFTVATNPVMRFSLLTLCAASAAGVVGLFATGFIRRIAARLPWKVLRYRAVEALVDLVSVSRFVALAPLRALRIGLFSAAMHLLNVLSIVVIAYMVGVTASPWLIGLIAIPVMLLATLPISLAGWGVREAAMVTGLGQLGVPADIALTVSVSFGLSMLFASLPGLPTLLFWRSTESSACPV
jgi:glycosyltransferase 2 family protein